MSEAVGWVNRAEWPPGPWDAEPEDKVEFRHAGFACLLVRGSAGAWCGYVGMPPGHRWHGAAYDDVRVIDEEGEASYPDVHGGLTYAAACQVNGHICHAPAPGEPDDIWWLGFDCNHSGDVAPRDEGFHLRFPEHAGVFEPRLGRPTGWGGVHRYQTRDYARRETERLAEQLGREP